MAVDSNDRKFDELIGAAISNLRMQQGIDPQAVADAVSMTVDDYLAHERGEGRFHAVHLFRIAQRLNTPLAELIDRIERGTSDAQRPEGLPKAE